MIKVKKAKDGKQWHISVVAKNRHILSNTENLKSKASVRKNALAQLRIFGGTTIQLQWPDGTTEHIIA